MSNPILSSQKWDDPTAFTHRAEAVMTVEGTALKTAFLLMIMGVTMSIMWSTFWVGGQVAGKAMMPWAIGGGIAGLVLGLIANFFPRSSPFVGPLLAVAKGVLLGAITMVFEVAYPGLALIAAVFTAATLGITLALYGMRIIRTSPAFVKGVVIATVALMLGVGVLALLGIFGIGGGIMATLNGSGPIGIAFSVICVVLATFNLLVDFHLIEEGAKNHAPKWMEWVGAVGLLVTLVWLYIEILNLLRKLREE